tara:strand:+ start:6231 stop:6812 length:582 start_codon:yes stop_codon:yes gene_type:complete
MTAEEEDKEVVEESDEEIEIPIKKEPEKPVKAKRIMSPEALEKLALARKKAFEVKSANAKIRAENKKVLVKQITEEQEVATKEKIKKSIKPKPIKQVKEVVEEEEEEEDEPIVKKVVKKKKKKQVVIVEESSSSDDESNVVYIKRRSSKKPPKEQPVAPVAPVAPPEPPPVVRQEISAFDRQLMLQRAALRLF